MLILASQSPRRKEILEAAGIPFEVRTANIDESVRQGEAPMSYVRRLAASKAMAVPRNPSEIILAADTTVVVNGEILGKPESDVEKTEVSYRNNVPLDVVKVLLPKAWA